MVVMNCLQVKSLESTRNTNSDTYSHTHTHILTHTLRTHTITHTHSDIHKEKSWKRLSPRPSKENPLIEELLGPGGCLGYATLKKAISQCLVKWRMYFPCDSVISFLGTNPKEILSQVPSGMGKEAHSPIVSRWWEVGGSLGYHHQGSLGHNVVGTPWRPETQWLETEIGYTHCSAGGS